MYLQIVHEHSFASYKLQTWQLCESLFTPHKCNVDRIRISGNYVRNGLMKCTWNFGLKTWREQPLRRPRYRWEDNIRMDLRKTGWEGVDRIHLAHDRDQWWVLVNMVMNLWVTWKAQNFLTSWMTISFSRRMLFHGVS